MKLVLTCSLILLASLAFTQPQTPAIKPDAVILTTLRKEIAATAPAIPINRIYILDSRNDTTSFGYSIRKPVKKYSFKNGFVHELVSWFTTYLHANGNGDGNTLLVNIKKLRVSEEAALKVFENGKTGQPGNGWDEGIIIKIEYFLQKDSLFTPLYRFDSIIAINGNPDKYKEEFISTGLRESLVKLLEINAGDRLSKKKITFTDIQRSNNKEADLPVYTDTVYKKGIYKTFADFKMNVVSTTDFELKKGKLTDIIYIKENGSEYPLHNIWGFCDGKDLFINSCDKYSKLIRTGNTFYFQGMKSLNISTYKGNAVAGAYIFGPTTFSNPATDQFTENDVKLKYYQLDMDNGQVY